MDPFMLAGTASGLTAGCAFVKALPYRPWLHPSFPLLYAGGAGTAFTALTFAGQAGAATLVASVTISGLVGVLLGRIRFTGGGRGPDDGGDDDPEPTPDGPGGVVLAHPAGSKRSGLTFADFLDGTTGQPAADPWRERTGRIR